MEALKEEEAERIVKVRLRPIKKLGRPSKRKQRDTYEPDLSPADLVRRERKRRKQSEAAKKRHADPAYREENLNQLAEMREGRANAPVHFSRLGVPDGWTRTEADVQRQDDQKRADKLIEKMTEQGMIEPVSGDDFEVMVLKVDGKLVELRVPKTEAGMAQAALREAVVAALSPLTHADKRLAAIRTVLEWTKAKPAQTVNNNISSPEEWLQAALKDNAASDGNNGAS